MRDKPKYQLIENIKFLGELNGLLNDERDILWSILDSLPEEVREKYIDERTKIASLHSDNDDKCIKLLTANKALIKGMMRELGFDEAAPDVMHYTRKDCNRRFRVRARYPALVVEKSEPVETFDRWANSIESIYYLTAESGDDLISWATDEVK